MTADEQPAPPFDLASIGGLGVVNEAKGLCMKLTIWLKERELNARRLAAGKAGADRAGWLEDAEHLELAHAAVVERDKMRDALAIVVADWTQQFERNGHLAPAWVKQAREALGVYEGPLKRLTEPSQPTRHQQREAWRTGENGL